MSVSATEENSLDRLYSVSSFPNGETCPTAAKFEKVTKALEGIFRPIDWDIFFRREQISSVCKEFLVKDSVLQLAEIFERIIPCLTQDRAYLWKSSKKGALPTFAVDPRKQLFYLLNKSIGKRVDPTTHTKEYAAIAIPFVLHKGCVRVAWKVSLTKWKESKAISDCGTHNNTFNFAEQLKLNHTYACFPRVHLDFRYVDIVRGRFPVFRTCAIEDFYSPLDISTFHGLSEKEKLKVVYQLVCHLCLLHEDGRLHGCICKKNILWRPLPNGGIDVRWKTSEFSCKPDAEAIKFPLNRGFYPYLPATAPELIYEHAPVVLPLLRGESWALGYCLYEMLCEENPACSKAAESCFFGSMKAVDARLLLEEEIRKIRNILQWQIPAFDSTSISVLYQMCFELLNPDTSLKSILPQLRDWFASYVQ
jgi:hypothetical protein